jgi:hypothetical protein
MIIRIRFLSIYFLFLGEIGKCMYNNKILMHLNFNTILKIFNIVLLQIFANGLFRVRHAWKS